MMHGQKNIKKSFELFTENYFLRDQKFWNFLKVAWT